MPEQVTETSGSQPFQNDAPLIEARGITLNFGGRAVLDAIDVSVSKSEIVTLIGPNGSGKSSIVRVMLGLQQPDRGTVRRSPGLTIGYMPQRMSVDPALPLTVGRFLALGVEKRKHRTHGHRRAVLKEVGAHNIMETALSDVSGGEFQRVLLARALLRNPDLLVLDEPTQGVDVTGQAELYNLITSIRDQRQCGVLMVSHDLHLVMAQTDRVICLNHHVCCAGSPETVANDPGYIALFGKQVAESIAVYHHHHDHTHDHDGHAVPIDGAHEGGDQSRQHLKDSSLTDSSLADTGHG